MQTPRQYMPVHYSFDTTRRTLCYVNSTCELLSGYTHDELISRDDAFYDALIPEADLPKVKAKHDLCNGVSDVQTISYHIITKDGCEKRVYDRFKGLRDASNQVTSIEGMVMDESTYLQFGSISELIAYREAININTIVSISDLRGTIIYANELFCEVSKYSRTELVGKNHRIVNSGYHSKYFFAELWGTIASGKMWRGEILNKAKDGSLYWVDAIIMPIVGHQNRVTSYLSLRTVIDDRKSAEVLRSAHLKSLEDMAFFISHNFRGPVCTILGLVNLMLQQSKGNERISEELLRHLTKTGNDLEVVTHRLSILIDKYETNYKGRSNVSTEDY